MSDGGSPRLTRYIQTRKRRLARLRAQQHNRQAADQFLKVVALAYAALQASYKNLCKSYGYYDTESAEDVYGDTLLKCFHTIKAKGFVGAHYSAYFTTSLRQNLQNHINKERKANAQAHVTLKAEVIDNEEVFVMNVTEKVSVVSDAMQEEDDERESDYQRMVQVAKLNTGRDKLPVKFQEIINLRYEHDLKYREICRILGIPMTTVKTRLNTARKLLKNTIK